MSSTPWGPSQNAKHFADGVDFYSTASHGGFAVNEERFKQICHTFPNIANGAVKPLELDGCYWFEEDRMYAYVVLAFKNMFPEKELDEALKTLANWYPDAWEKFTGKKLEAGQSIIRDKKIFEKEHRNDFIATSASMLDLAPGIVHVYAYRSADAVEKRFILREEAYNELFSKYKTTRIVLDDSVDALEVEPGFRKQFEEWAPEARLEHARGAFIARGVYKPKTPEGYPVTCGKIDMGGYGAKLEDRKTVVIPAAEWESRPMQALLVVNDDGTLEPIEYNADSPAPRP